MTELKNTYGQAAIELGDFTDGIDPMDIQAITLEGVAPEVENQVDASTAAYKKLKNSMIDLQMTSKQMATAIRSTLVNAFSGLGNLIGRELANDNPKASLMAFLGGIASMVGEMAISIGTSMLAMFNLMANPSPGLAIALIAGGIGLVALGAYATSTAAQINSKSNEVGGGASMPRFADRDASMQGEWRIRGADLVYVLDKQGYRSSVVGG